MGDDMWFLGSEAGSVVVICVIIFDYSARLEEMCI